MVNSLTRQAGIQLGPLLLETLVKHYFDRLVNEDESQGRAMTKLRQEELLYDEAFNVVKTFLEASTKHTVEELQKFSNTRTPSPPSVHVLRLLVPMSCCDEAARILIQAFGGEEMTRKIVGGTKWWQVRGVKGVDAEWIAAKKDWREAKKRYKMAQERERATSGEHSRAPTTAPSEASSQPSQNGVPADSTPHYQPEMDEMRCLLYTHGGGYYFGSVDQERYSIQRYARKINGRVFAINYRLAPQYPFPCALQDLIAAYLFLIRPPEGASHRPVNPAHIVVSGDSAGGGLTLALLQVIRDCGLPMPAGAVLVSPWCDLTHSFPSIHTNTATDVLPPYGLSFYKPSTLWPPPPDELNVAVRERLRTRIRQAISLRSDKKEEAPPRHVPTAQSGHDLRMPDTGRTLHLGSTASLPTIQSGYSDQTVTCTTKDGETLTIDQQIHLYAPNYLLTHPLISPVVSYLGGLCPLFVIAGDAEVLRDEIIYVAHKAADPSRFPIKQEVRDMYPALNGIEDRYGPTQVHLQVYDDAAHVLPILFSFTTPAKYCFRAIATFIRHVTGMLPPSVSDSVGNIPITLSPPTSPGIPPTTGSQFSMVEVPDDEHLPRPSSLDVRSTPTSREPSPRPRGASLFSLARKPADDSTALQPKRSLRRAFSAHVSRAGVLFKGGSAHTAQQSATIVESPPSTSQPESRQSPTPPDGATHEREDSGDVAGPRFYGSGMKEGSDERRAGEPEVYQNGLSTMIRERVSTHGVIRPLEPESELPAFSLPPELTGVVSELAIRRYHDAKAKFDKKFSSTVKTIEKHRRRNLDIAHKDAMRNMTQLQHYAAQDNAGGEPSTSRGIAAGLQSSGSWSWAWALDADERPPPSSIVARRDTAEAVALARIADQSVLAEEDVVVSGNNLWQLMVNFLTTSPEKRSKHHRHGSEHALGDSRKSKEERIRSRFAQLVSDHKKHTKATSPTVAKAADQ